MYTIHQWPLENAPLWAKGITQVPPPPPRPGHGGRNSLTQVIQFSWSAIGKKEHIGNKKSVADNNPRNPRTSLQDRHNSNYSLLYYRGCSPCARVHFTGVAASINNIGNEKEIPKPPKIHHFWQKLHNYITTPSRLLNSHSLLLGVQLPYMAKTNPGNAEHLILPLETGS